MKRFCFSMLLLCGIISAITICSCASETDDKVVSRYYCYQNASSAFEDDVVELQMIGDSIVAGYFWCNSDEFCDAREGFLPGFTVLKIQEATIKNGRISFVLNSKGVEYFSAPVDVSIRSAAEALTAGCHPWLQQSRFFQDSVVYKGTFSGDKFVIESKSKYGYFEPRAFNLIEADAIKGLNRMLAPDDEENNRRLIASQKKSSMSSVHCS